MNSPSLFSHDDYQTYLKERLQSSDEAWGNVTRAAKAANCQRSYLSRVMNGHIHLTPDHAFKLSRYWELSPLEENYFLGLVEKARAGSKEYREHIEAKLFSLKQENENLSKRLERSSIEPGEKELTYYSAWYWSALHILVSIPQFQTVSEISKKLNLSPETVQSSLSTLQKFGLVKFENQKWRFSSTDIHIGKNSLLVGLHHNNWRQRALLHAQEKANSGIHYTTVQTMSRSAVEKIKQMLLQFIDESSKVAGPSKEEELVCITCDFFQV